MIGRLRPFAPQLVLPAILLIAFVVYAPTLNDWFQSDDFWFLRSSQSISFGEYAADSFDFRQTGTLPEFDRYRPLYPIVWKLQYAVFGLNALGYHAVLLMLHLSCTALVWFIAFRLTRHAWAASLAALIFSLHPAYAGAVTWLSGGNRVFATFPYLLSLLLFMKYLDGTRRRAIYYLGSLLAFVSAILFHSSALTLAAVLPAYVFLVARKPAEALRVAAWVQFAPFAVVSIALVGVQLWVRSHLGIEDQFRFGMHQYSIYGHYLGMALFPSHWLDTNGLWEPLSWLRNRVHGLEGPASLAMILITVVLLNQRRWPHLGIFVAWWFYLSLLPDSTLFFVPLRRALYLPGAALAIFLVAAVLWVKATFPGPLVRLSTQMAPALLVAALLPTIFLTLQYEQTSGRGAAENEKFAMQLRASVPTLESGGTLYVVNAPLNLVVFTDSPLDALVELYYGEADVRSLPANQVAETERALGPKDRLFHYRP